MNINGVISVFLADLQPHRRGPVGACLEKGHKNHPRDGAPLYEHRLRAGAVQHGEEKAPGKCGRGLPLSKGGAVRRVGAESSAESAGIGQGKWFQTKRGDT